MKQHCVLLIWLIFAGFQANAQFSKEKRADKYFDNLAYAKAIELYEEIALSGDTSIHIAKRLADSYRLINDWTNAEPWYFKVVNSTSASPIDFYYLSEALRANQRYETATEWMNKYAQLAKTDSRVLHELDSRNQLNVLLTGSESIEINPVEINSEEADFGAANYMGTKIVYSSSRSNGKAAEYTYAWNGKPFLDLYIADIDTNGALTNNRPFSQELNSRYHEGPVTFSPDGNTIYFTRNNYFQKVVGKSKEDVNNLKLYKATKIGDKWGQIESMPFNSDEYSCGHPSLSPDGTKLYLIADMPGSIGGTDIYVCHKIGDKWSDPINLGDSINTEGNEMFPYIHQDGTLYYSSNGFFGLGGLDIYMASPADSLGNFNSPINLAKPLNSSLDDFAFTINNEKTKGYFSSNRPDGKGDDDIYRFELIFKPRPDEPIVFLTGEPIAPTPTIDSLKIGEVMILRNIYYDLDKWDIRPDASKDLKLVIDFMQKNPTAKIELSSHTDSRAPTDYNTKLARKRAASAMLYIVEKGNIDPARIVAQGYGETKLINECADGVDCTEAQHQANRRTEVKVLEK